jgi:hypothetical protein
MPARLSRPIVAGMVFVVTAICTTAAGQSASRSDAAARAIIFDEQHADESALDVHGRAMATPIEERFALLRRWVLPGDDHLAFRLQAGFTPTNPAPPQVASPAAVGATAPSGGDVVSPALDLIEAAAALGKLDELWTQVDAAPAETVNNQIARLALLALIDTARSDLDSAGRRLDELFLLVPADASTLGSARDALLLCVQEAAKHPRLSRVAVDPAYRIVVSYQEVYDRQPWHRQFSAAYARCRQTSETSAAAPQSTSSQWLAASRPLARRRGAGCPPAAWKFAAGEVENISSHDEDYLYFAIPLRGNFDVECDVTGFGWRDSHLLVAGRWVAPVYDHQSYDVGDVRTLFGRVKFEPRLTKTDKSIHYRTTVREGVATTWFNGRKIHEEPLPVEHDPWLAIRSGPRHEGGVSNLRITGTPQIPATLRLADSPDLAGWIPYYGDSVESALRNWTHGVGENGAGEIRGRRRLELPTGSHEESLLLHHRPMLEDGVIEYEFLYEPGRLAAHPALDRLCFLLEEDGVKIHWLTDGKFDRTGLAPDNVSKEPQHRRDSDTLPLRAGQWNHVRLALAGDVVRLSLNQELVYQRRLEPTNARHFGLFHYADRSELRVRNLAWTGAWPRELPGLEEQSLAVDETGFLDARLPELTANFSHDFAADGLPLDRFSVKHGDLSQHVSVQPDGVHVQRPAQTEYRSVSLAPSLSVSGDFDISARFDGLVTEAGEGGNSSLMLFLHADSPDADEAAVYRRRSLTRGVDQQLIHCVRVGTVNGQVRRKFFNQLPVEAAAGTLRLARRGDQLYYLFAENDSRQFRLLGREPFPANDLQLEGVRIIAQIYGDAGLTRVVWKSLDIRAQRLAGPAMQDRGALIAELNRQRDQLPKSFAHDLTRAAPHESLFYRWTDVGEWRVQDKGLLITAPGTDQWSSAGASLQKQVEGDFDVSISFDPLRLDFPAHGLGTSVYLQLELADQHDTQASMILNRTSEGQTEAVAQFRRPADNGGFHYLRVGRVSVRSATELRLARRGDRLIFLVKPSELEGQLVVAQAEIGREPLKLGGTRILVHTGGAGRESRVLWKGIHVKAEQITPEALPAASAARSAAPTQPAPKPPSKSLFQSIFDFFSQ